MSFDSSDPAVREMLARSGIGAVERTKEKQRPAHVWGEMNATESAYAGYLNLRKAAGEVIDWQFESVTFTLGPKLKYTPDFWVVLADGSICIDETKGFERDDAIAKFKMAAGKFPALTWRMLERRGSGWVVTRGYAKGSVSL